MAIDDENFGREATESVSDGHSSSNIYSELGDIRSKIDSLKKQRVSANILRVASFLFGAIAAIFAGVGYYFSFGSYFVFLFSAWAAISVILAIVFSINDIDQEIASAENDLVLAATDVSPIQRRSERLFRSHEIQLSKYYSQTLRQSNLIFFGGVACIVAGFTVIGYTLFGLLQATPAREFSESVLTAVFGFSSGIAVNLVGAIFLRMFASISESLSLFHHRLVLTNRLYFSHFLISNISSEDQRSKALLELALRIPQDQPAGSTDATS